VIAAELKSIADEARGIVETVSRRERLNLSSPTAWNDFLGAMASKSWSDQLSAESRMKLVSLCIRWRRLYHRLKFDASTRPVWNS